MPTYSDPGGLDEIALRAGADIRSPLLRTLVDLYLQKSTHTSEEERHFTELMLRLLDQADAATRAAIAHRLASYPSLPQTIARCLKNDTSRIPDLSRPVSEDTDWAPTQSSPESERVTAAELSELFFAARSTERRLILMNVGYAANLIVPPLSGDFREATSELESAALARKPAAFLHALERYLGITPALARRIVTDPLGEPIVVAAKAIGVAPEAAQRILLFINPVIGQSISRVYALATLFESIDTKAAHALVGIWRAANPPSTMRQAPVPEPTDVASQSIRRRVAGPTTAQQHDTAHPSWRNAGGNS